MTSEHKHELNYWPSFTDIFASLFFIFLILFSVYYVNEGKKNKAIKKDWVDLKELLKNNTNQIELDEDKMNFVIQEAALFDHNESYLKKGGIKLAQDLGAIFGQYLNEGERHKNFAIVVEGHADRSGDPATNDKLSLERANSLIKEMKRAMKPYLDNSVVEDILIPVGYGESKPKEHAEIDGKKWDANRRVEIKIIPKFNEATLEIWHEVMSGT